MICVGTFTWGSSTQGSRRRAPTGSHWVPNHTCRAERPVMYSPTGSKPTWMVYWIRKPRRGRAAGPGAGHDMANTSSVGSADHSHDAAAAPLGTAVTDCTCTVARLACSRNVPATSTAPVTVTSTEAGSVKAVMAARSRGWDRRAAQARASSAQAYR